MDSRLSQTARIVAASLKNNPHIKPDELPDLIRAIHAALPNVTVTAKPMPVAQPEPEAIVEPLPGEDVPGGEQEAPEASDETSEADPVRAKPMGIMEALAASRARFSGEDTRSSEERIADAAAGTAAARDAVMANHTSGEPEAVDDADEAETEAHAS